MVILARDGVTPIIRPDVFDRSGGVGPMIAADPLPLR